jgi:hypothetical protein
VLWTRRKNHLRWGGSCNWNVSCPSSNAISNFGYLSLTGTIPEELGQLTSLISLSIYGNQLTGPIPSSLPSSLTYLRLDNNKLNGTIPESIGGLSSLTELYLFDNKLDGTIPESLGDLSSLVIIDLGNNELTGEIPSAIGEITSLTFCDVLPSNTGLCRAESFTVCGNDVPGKLIPF